MFRLERGWMVIAGLWFLGGCSSSGTDRQASSPAKGMAAHLAPDPASAAMSISVVLSDPLIDPANCRFEWRRNGNLIAGATTNVLEPSQFAKGDRIEVVVSVPNAAGGSPTIAKAKVGVVNTPPKITRAELSITTDAGESHLHANVEGTDLDGDRLTYAYRWLLNGGTIDQATAASFPVNAHGRGDRIAVEVMASDGDTKSPPMTSVPYVMDNAPPQFSSQPMAPKPGDQAFQYQAVASDPDGDPLHYELSAGPQGMSIDPQGNVSWTLPSPRTGAYPVRLLAIDSKGGQAIQDFTLQLGVQEAKQSPAGGQ